MGDEIEDGKQKRDGDDSIVGWMTQLIAVEEKNKLRSEQVQM